MIKLRQWMIKLRRCLLFFVRCVTVVGTNNMHTEGDPLCADPSVCTSIFLLLSLKYTRYIIHLELIVF